MHIIETKRTYLRELSLDDVDNVFRIFSDPKAMRYSPAETTQDRAAAEGLIRWNLDNYQRHGSGAWAVILKSTGCFIGQAGLIPHETGLEIFYSLIRELWGCGFAIEVASACRDHGFQKLRKASLISIIHPQNERAIRVARKLGMKDAGPIRFWNRENRLFEIHREESFAAVRDARRDDAPAIAELLAALGYPSPVAQVEQRIVDCAASDGTAIFVAESAQRVAGVISFHCIPLFHADGFLGRITSLVVSPDHRRQGIGRLLVLAGEEFGWARGCLRVEVTSGDHRPDAHAFYEQLGYKLDSRRFIKQVVTGN